MTGNHRKSGYVCVPPGNGMRVALDRDLDEFYDNDERAQGSNPADPLSK